MPSIHLETLDTNVEVFDLKGELWIKGMHGMCVNLKQCVSLNVISRSPNECVDIEASMVDGSTCIIDGCGDHDKAEEFLLELMREMERLR